MKFTKYIAVALAFSVLTLGAVLPTKTIATVKNTNTVYNAEPVVAKETDFKYSLYPTVKPEKVILNQYVGKDTKIIIPDTIEGLPVTNLRLSVFTNNDKIEYIRLPRYLRVFNGSCFRLTPNLNAIDVDVNNPYFASKDGFAYSKDFKTLCAAPGSLTGEYTIIDGVTKIEQGAFSHRFMLTKINMPNSVEAIEANAFSYCYSLTSVRLSDNLKVIGSSAFSNCEMDQVHLPASIEAIGDRAFLGGIDSNNNVFYYFTNGIYYVPGTPSEEYVKSLHIPNKYAFSEPRTVTNIKEKITIVDNKGILPKAGLIDIDLKPIPENELKALAPTRYSEIKGYDFNITINGKPIELNGDVVIKFGGLMEGTPKTSGKVYRVTGNEVTELSRDPQAPFIGTQTKTLGKFIVLANNDFSIKGDVDGNGVVSLYDVRIALAHSAGLKVNLTGEQISCANMDDSTDGVRLNDVKEILKKAAGIIS